MRELLDDIDRWRTAGKRIALARVVDIQGSGPRGAGAAMAVNEDGEVIGSVSGGCSRDRSTRNLGRRTAESSCHVWLFR